MGAIWLKIIVQLHANILLINPALTDLLGPILGIVENRIALQAPLNRLLGKLSLLVNQLSQKEDGGENEDVEPLLNYIDKGEFLFFPLLYGSVNNV